MSSFDLKRLRYFVAVAELGSVTRAASELHVAQPALSREMRLLEGEVGGELFARGPQGVRLTELGQTLAAQCRELLADLRSVREGLRDDVREPTGSVVIGVAQTIGPVLAPVLVALAAKRLARVHLQIRELMSSDIPDLLRTESIDFALSYAIPAGRGIRSTDLFSEDLFVVGTSAVARQCLGKSTAAEIVFSELRHVPLYLSARTNGFREELEQMARARKVRLNVVAEIDSVAIRREMALDGAGFTILSGATIRRDMSRRGVFAARIVDPRVRREVCFVSRSGSAVSRAAREIAGLARESLSGLIAGGLWPGANMPASGIPRLV
ncbi:MAG TPA: LysR family transcriptional regulator [Burkholderiales bacterium]|nr:LysR family transcriptional regulator [Burkholderiales bacterium]